MTSLAAAHRRVCDIVDLARVHGDNDVLTRLRFATIHLWYALHSSDDTDERLAAAEDQLNAARKRADGDVATSLQRVLDQLPSSDSGGVGA